MTKNELEERLIDFSASVIQVAAQIETTTAGEHLSDQITRSGMSASLNYGEAQDAESRKDFIYKVKIILKELRETMIGLKLIKKNSMIEDETEIDNVMTENNELISIFVKSVQTAKKNADD